MEEKNLPQNSDYVNYSMPSVPVPKPVSTEAPLTWRDAAGPLAALILAVLYWQTFALEHMDTGRFDGPGLGVFLFTAAYYAAVFLMIGKRPSRGGLILTGASLILALTCFLYAHSGLTILNCFLILGLSAMATFSLSGQSRRSVFSFPAIPEAVRLSVLALFTRIDQPFRAAARAGKNNRHPLIRTVLTILGTLALLAVVLALLASADMVFGSFFDGLRRRLEDLDPGRFLRRTFRTVVLTLLIASGLCFLREPVPDTAVRKNGSAPRHVLPFLLPTLALDAAYAVFCAVQIRYLFGGAETAAMAGGWAEYARTGFFQLVAVTVINLVLCVPGARPDRLSARGGGALRAASAVMLVLTAIILASAFYRMRLYIGVFGLSVLRLMTLWGMLTVAVGILLAARKLILPDGAFWPAFFGFALGTWCLFCLAGPAGRVADFNVDAYLDGRLETVDVDYLRELSPDAVPALERLSAASPVYHPDAEKVLDRFTDEVCHHPVFWTQRKACYLQLHE